MELNPAHKFQVPRSHGLKSFPTNLENSYKHQELNHPFDTSHPNRQLPSSRDLYTFHYLRGSILPALEKRTLGHHFPDTNAHTSTSRLIPIDVFGHSKALERL